MDCAIYKLDYNYINSLAKFCCWFIFGDTSRLVEVSMLLLHPCIGLIFFHRDPCIFRCTWQCVGGCNKVVIAIVTVDVTCVGQDHSKLRSGFRILNDARNGLIRITGGLGCFVGVRMRSICLLEKDYAQASTTTSSAIEAPATTPIKPVIRQCRHR